MVQKGRKLQSYDVLLLIFLSVPLFFLPMSFDVFNLPKLWLFVLLVVGLTVNFALSQRIHLAWRNRQTLLINFLMMAFLVFVSISSFVSESTAPRIVFGYPGRANGLLLYISLALFIMVASRLKIDDEFEKIFARRFYQLTFLFALYSAAQFFGIDPIDWNNPYNPVIGTLGNPNFSGAFLGISGFVFFVIGTMRRNHKSVLFMSSITLLFLAISTDSLQAYLIYAVGLLLFLISIVYKRASKYVFGLVAASLVILNLFAFLSFLGFGPLGERLFQYTLKLRVMEYWRVGIQISLEYPLTGIGPDSYVEGFRKFKGQNFVEQYSQSVTADSAHNSLLNFLANFGYPAFVILILLIIFITYKSVKAIFSKTTSNYYLIAIPYIWILGLIQSLFSIDQIGLFVFQWTCGALLLNQRIFERITGPALDKGEVRGELVNRGDHFARNEISLLIVLLVAFLGSGFLRQDIKLAQLAQNSLEQTANQNVVDDILAEFTDFSTVEVRRAIVISDFLLRSSRLEEADKLLVGTLQQDPEAYEALEQLSRIAAFRNDPDREYLLRSRLKVVDPFNYSNTLTLAEIALHLGLKEEARALVGEVLNLPFDVGLKESATALLASG